MATIVTTADATVPAGPTLNRAFIDYAQARELGALHHYIARKIHHAVTADTTGPDQHRTPQPTAA